MSRAELRAALLLTAAALDVAVDRVHQECERRGISPYDFRYPDGTYVLLDALASQGQVYAALAHLEAAP